jgi:hypothetical protein
MRIQMIDPPAGWRYGFPKPYVPGDENSLDGWLLANGYPQHEVDQWPKGVPCRLYWVDWGDKTPGRDPSR